MNGENLKSVSLVIGNINRNDAYHPGYWISKSEQAVSNKGRCQIKYIESTKED